VNYNVRLFLYSEIRVWIVLCSVRRCFPTTTLFTRELPDHLRQLYLLHEYAFRSLVRILGSNYVEPKPLLSAGIEPDVIDFWKVYSLTNTPVARSIIFIYFLSIYTLLLHAYSQFIYGVCYRVYIRRTHL
jgi:hypothetical protein